MSTHADTPLPSQDRHAWLHALLHRLEHVLPAQAPIKDFVHHNTLHGFQGLPFRDALAAAEAATGNHGFQSPEAFRAYFAQGRIDLSDLNAALDETPDLRADEALSGGLTRRDVLVAGLLHDLTPPDAAGLRWHIDELDGLSRFQTDVPAKARQRLLDGKPEAAELERLWRTCHDAHAGAEDDAPWTPERIKAEAEARLSWLMDRVGADLSLRGLLQRLTGRDILDELRPYLVRHLAAYVDLGMAAWHHPARERGFYAAWLASTQGDGHFELAELTGWHEIVERLPDDPLDCIVRELGVLGLDESRWADYLETLAKELPGWSGMFLWRDGHANYEGDATPVAMADYLAVRLALERIHAQHLSARHFKNEATLHGIRGYLHHHPAELLVRLSLYEGRMPEWLDDQGHRLVREAVLHAAEEDDTDWLPVARLVGDWDTHAHRPDDAANTEPRAWRLFLLCQYLGLNADALAAVGAEALLACLDDLTPQAMGWVWLQAYERHYREQIFSALAANIGRGPWKTRDRRPDAQLMFCMDDREEGLRRHLEELRPDVETLGAAAHFNVPHAWRGLDDDHAVALCPVVPSVVVPAHEVREAPRAEAAEAHARHVARRATRLNWKRRLMQGTRLGLVGPALLSLAAAPAALGVLAGKAFAPSLTGRLIQGLKRRADGPVATRIDYIAPNDSAEARPENRRLGFTDVEQADRVQTLLRNTGLTYGFAPIVVIAGHASHSLNNPHGSAYNCGACAGRWSGPNARLVANMANRPEVRTILRQRGIDIPDDCWFIGAEHDTCDDIVTWLDTEDVPAGLQDALAKLRADVNAACVLHAKERCRRFMSAPLNITPVAAWRHVTGRANDYSQARPELGHATNACAFFGRRSLSRGAFFDRRAFLISYDPSQDPDGSVIERHLLINGAVGAGISLEYYFSTANNERYGCGTKVMHNVAGLIGVMEGASSDLRTGLPRQMIEVHEAMRLLAVVEQKTELLTEIYLRQPPLQELVGNGWVQLAAIDPDSGAIARFIPGTGWVPWQPGALDLPRVEHSIDWVLGKREALPPALVEKAVEHAT
jgi:uncharacterized protein YbcC (UPF0753/DUF2309 family)